MNIMPNLLLLHGALGATDQLDALRQVLMPDFEVFTFNFSGHGGRALPEDGLHIDTFAQELADFLDAHQLEQVHVFGYSMGGYVALSLLQHYPEYEPRIGRIVTLGTKFDWSPESAEREAGMLNADVLEQKVPKFVEMLQKRHAPNDWRTLLEATTAMLHGLGNGEAFDMEDLTGIEHPVLILRGELDNMVGADESENAAAFLPNGEYRELPATKHPIEQVDVAMLAEVLKEYFYTA